jgi:PPOX class probable F420-dependent enzyme
VHIHCQVRELIEQPKFGVLATINADGTPQQTVMWYELIDDYILMNTEVGRTKVSNIMRDNRVSLCIEDSYNYVTLRGRAELNFDPEQAQTDIARLAHRYREPEAAHRLIANFQAEERITIWMSIDQVISKF